MSQNDKYINCDPLQIRKKLFDAYEILSKDILCLREVIQNPQQYTEQDIENWMDKVKKVRDESRAINNATFQYINNNRTKK